jgi:hypothetical protein
MGDPRKKVKRVKDKSWVSTVLHTECVYEVNGPNAPTLKYSNTIGL